MALTPPSPGAQRMGAAVVALLGLAACSKFESGQDSMTWARAALERNERLQVVATDPQANTFTVRLKDTGELRVVRADQIVAAPPAAAQVLTVEPAATPVAPSTEAQSPTAQGPADAGAPPKSQSSSADALASAGEPAQSASAEQAQAASEQAETESGPRSESAAGANPGHLLASGPGYTIKAGDSKTAAPRRVAAVGPRGALERRHDPIICQGERFLQIDNRNLEFDGDAVSAEDGCEIHITNSRITAKGVGVLARKSNVHIENSQIEGDSASVDASDGAQVYSASSTFKGLRRRMDDAAFHDLGGNVWN